jgi:hypothetical protein
MPLISSMLLPENSSSLPSNQLTQFISTFSKDVIDKRQNQVSRRIGYGSFLWYGAINSKHNKDHRPHRRSTRARLLYSV